MNYTAHFFYAELSCLFNPISYKTTLFAYAGCLFVLALAINSLS
jgi:hypothetical protein